MTDRSGTLGANDQLKRAMRRSASTLRFATAFAVGRAELVLRPRNRNFRGAYPSYAAAMAAVPQGFDAGYSNDVADVAFEAMCAVAPRDYPILFWMQNLRDDVTSVLDFGGHMGTKYRAFDPYLSLSSASVDWIILETPPMVAAGIRQAEADGLSEKLRFLSEPTDVPDVDLLLVSGIFQYCDGGCGDIVAAIGRKPKHILLNKVALRSGPAVFTLERIGDTYVPYQFRGVTSSGPMFTRLVMRSSISGRSHRCPTQFVHPRNLAPARARAST